VVEQRGGRVVVVDERPADRHRNLAGIAPDHSGEGFIFCQQGGVGPVKIPFDSPNP
jgi:hypothetical protein